MVDDSNEEFEDSEENSQSDEDAIVRASSFSRSSALSTSDRRKGYIRARKRQKKSGADNSKG